MSHETSKDIVIAEEQALTVYLESLFLDIPEVIETDVEEVQKEQVAEQSIHPAPILDTAALPVIEEQPTTVESPIDNSPASLIPDWGKESFQCLLFNISGLTLAVPLVNLNGLIELPDDSEISDIPGHNDWYSGVFYHRDKTVKIANMDKIVLPQGRVLKKAQASDGVTYIILINEGHWGLRCDSIGTVISLSEEQVKWRSKQTKRRWLAGTVIDKMCALIDAEELAQILEERMNEKSQDLYTDE